VHRLIDTHVHLEEIEDLAQAITDAKSAGIIAIIAIGSDNESNRKVLTLAQEYKDFISRLNWRARGYELTKLITIYQIVDAINELKTGRSEEI